MSEWQKVENKVEKSSVINEETSNQTPIPLPVQGEVQRELSPGRYTSGGRRRGMHPFAAPIGLLVLILAAVGLVSLVRSGVHAVERAQDDSALRSELYDFLLPVMQYNPEAFSDVNKTEQDSLLLAAIWRVTEAERIRQLIDSSGPGSYPIDDMGRMLIPISEIEESYMALFGSDVVIYHHTIGDEGMSFTVEYDEGQDIYHIPSSSSSSMYVTVIDTIKKKGDIYTVRVGYVLSTVIGRDEKGELVDPTVKDAEKFQLFNLQRVGEKGWKLKSITDENASGGSSKTFNTVSLTEESTAAAPSSTASGEKNTTTTN